VRLQTLAGRYELGRALGHGGMASVYLARDQALGRPVAV
jgi:eukaryotic-like serine/threonine-protein kinase